MVKLFALLASAIFSPSASAYLPPSFYIYTHIAEQRAKTPNPSLQISVSRPMGSGTEEVLGTISLPSWSPRAEGWPSLSLLFSGEAEALIQSVNSFGIPVTKESELLRAKPEQVAAMKDPPKPFYKPDKRMSLKRHRQTYAWVHHEKNRAIWLEKDTFLPLKIEGPCPAEVVELSWAKSGENKCELEFRNVYSLRRGSPQNSRLTVWKDGNPVLFFSFDRVVPPKAGGAPALTAETKLPANIAAIADSMLH